MRVSISVAALLLLFMLLSTPRVAAFSSSQSPVIRIGEWKSPNYGILSPEGEGLTFDHAGNLWVSDYYNSRVLGFTPPFSDNMSATYVIGQPDFLSNSPKLGANHLRWPEGITFDSQGYLWVADTNNNRILAFSPPFHNGMNASLVLGQNNFESNSSLTARAGLSVPSSIAFDKLGDLWVADEGNSRIVEFKPPFSTGMNASLLLGEPDFDHMYCQPSQLGYNRLCSNHSTLVYPSKVVFDPSGDLWTIDFPQTSTSVFGRILEFEPPFSSGMHASLVMQPVWASTIAFDSIGDLWVGCMECGFGGGRVLEYLPPFSKSSVVFDNGVATNSSLALGGSYTDSWDVVLVPVGISFDSAGNLWVADDRAYWAIDIIGRVVAYDAQVHPLDTPEGRVYVRNDAGLLAPLSSIPASEIESIRFPDGLFNFTIQGLNPGGSVRLMIDFPKVLPRNSGWWFNSNGSWIQLSPSQVLINGANVTLNLTGASLNGVISMLGGPATVTGSAQVSNTTSSANTSTSTTPPPTNIGGFSVESIVGGIITGVAVLTILRYRSRIKQLQSRSEK